MIFILRFARKDDEHRLQGVEIGIHDFTVVVLLSSACWNSLVHVHGLFESIVVGVDVLHFVQLRAESTDLSLVGVYHL